MGTNAGNASIDYAMLAMAERLIKLPRFIRKISITEDESEQISAAMSSANFFYDRVGGVFITIARRYARTLIAEYAEKTGMSEISAAKALLFAYSDE